MIDRRPTEESELKIRIFYEHQLPLYAHQNEDIVRLTAEELKAKLAAKERATG